MKNAFKKAVLVVLLSTGFYAKASESLIVKVTDNQNLIVELENVEEETLLFLQDKKGEILFKDSIRSNESYKKVINLEVIPMGIYYLHVEKENRILSKVLVKNEKGVVINEDVSGIIFKPHFRVDNNSVKFFFNNPKKDRIQVRVYDKVGVEMGSYNSSGSLIEKIFDFSNVPAGEYSMQVKAKNKDFFKKLRIQ